MYKSTKIRDDIVWIGVNDRKIEKIGREEQQECC